MNDFAINVLTAPLGQTYLFSVGQAGYIIKSKDGKLLAIDLYLSECVQRIEGNKGFHRLLPKLFYPFEIEFDVVVTTHPHWDHFDVDAIPELMSNRKTKLFASTDCQKMVKKLDMVETNITYVKPGETYTVDGFGIDFVSCDHGTGAPDAVGIIISVDGKRIYEAGDTCLRLDRVKEYLKKGKLDILIAPINGAFGNMNEKECAEFADAIKPALTIPCHYGMFASHGGNPGLFYDIMMNQYPENKFIIMAQGERITL